MPELDDRRRARPAARHPFWPCPSAPISLSPLDMSATPSKRPRAASQEASLDSPLKNGQRPASPPVPVPAATPDAPPPPGAEPPSAASFETSSSSTHPEGSNGAGTQASAVDRREESDDEEEEEEEAYDDTADMATRTDMYLDTVRSPHFPELLALNR